MSHPLEWLLSKTSNSKCWEDVEKREPSNTVGGNVNWCRHYGKQDEGVRQSRQQTKAGRERGRNA